MNSLNALIYSESAALFRKLFQHPDFYLVEQTGTFHDAITRTASNQFDLVFLDENLPDTFIQTFIQAVADLPSGPVFPRFVTICKDKKNTGMHQLDGSVSLLDDQAGIKECIKNAFAAPCGILYARRFSQGMEAAKAYLTEMGMNPGLKGFDYAAFAAAVLAGFRRNDIPLSQWLYPQIAKQYQTTSQAAERNIRTAIESVWLHGNLNTLQRYFGYTIDAGKGKATNAEFLYMLQNRIRYVLCHTSCI